MPCRYCRLRDNFVSDFKRRFSKKLEFRGDLAVDDRRYDEAISEYSAALSFDPASPGLFIKRSETYLARGSWNDGLDDANEVCLIASRSSVLVHI